MNSVRRGVVVFALTAFGLVLFAPVSSALSANVTRSYAGNAALEPGSIVSLTSIDDTAVTLANTSNSKKLIGVVVGQNDAAIAINPDPDRVQIAMSGTAEVLVGDLNGAVKIGDKVAISPFDGIGMKSAKGERVIGVALSDFKADSPGTITRQITDKQGNNKQLHISKIQISVQVGDDTSGEAEELHGLQAFAQSITGRKVATARVVISLVIAVVTLISLIIMIYSAIYGSIVSIGRNPLAKESVFRALRQVSWIATLTLVLGLGFIFLLLR